MKLALFSRRFAGAMFAMTVLVAVVCVAFPSLTLAAQDDPPAQASASQTADSLQSPLSDETAAEVKRVIMIFKQSLLEDDPGIRASAVTALGKLIDHDDTILDVIIERSRNDEAEVRLAAMSVLMRVRYPSERVIDGLLSLLADEAISEVERFTLTRVIISRSTDRVIARACAMLAAGTDAERAHVARMFVDAHNSLRESDDEAPFFQAARAAVDPLIEVAGDSSASGDARSASLEAVATIISISAATEAALRTQQREVASFITGTLTSYDRNGDGQIHLDEVGNADADLSINDGTTTVGYVSFVAIDKDRDGVITREELAQRIAVIRRSAENRFQEFGAPVRNRGRAGAQRRRGGARGGGFRGFDGGNLP